MATLRNTNRPNLLHIAVLVFAVGLPVLVAVACGPSAPAGQGSTPEAAPPPCPTSTPTPMPATDCSPSEFQTNPNCTLLLPTTSDFFKKYRKYGMAGEMEEHEKAQEEARAWEACGGTLVPSPTPRTLEIIIIVDKDARLTELNNLLNQHEAEYISCDESTAAHSAYCTAVVPVSLLKTLADTGWVLQMMQVPPASLSSAQNAPAGQTIRDLHGAAN